MVFRWKITRPPFHHAAEGVDVMQPGIEVEFETGSIGEAHGIYTDNKTALGEMFGAEIVSNATQVAEAASEAPQGDQAPPVKRGRGPNKPKPDAVAPAPIAIPGAEAPPTAPVAPETPHPLDIPEALRRPAAVAPPPPAPPAPPPTGILAGKIIAEMERKGVPTAPDGGQSFADWLATSGIIVKGATYPEAVIALRLQPDEKLGQIAQALGVA